MTAKTLRACLLLPGQPAVIVEDLDASLENLQAIVGGLVEVAHIGGPYVAIINEEGLLLGLDWNVEPNAGQPLAGPVILLRDGIDGELASLPLMFGAGTLAFLETRRLAPTPSSLDSFEERTGRPAISVTAF